MSETFYEQVDLLLEERLEARRGSPLYGSLPRYQHVERLGHEDVEGLLDGEVVVQEKLDGANTTVARVDDKLVICTRHRAISIGGDPPTGFRGLVEYVLAHEGIRSLMDSSQWILRGEWLVQHSLPYSPESMGKLYIFDVQMPNGSYVPYKDYAPELEIRGILYVPIIAQLDRPTVDKLVPYSQGASYLGPEREGVVIKRYDFRNRWGRTTWGKIVSADFKTKNSLAFGARGSDPAEIKFAALATSQYVLKTIQTVADARNETPRIQHMGEVLGRVWYDLFTEELWDFVKRERAKQFDFSAARRLVEVRTRDIALAYYNGVPMVK